MYPGRHDGPTRLSSLTSTFGSSQSNFPSHVHRFLNSQGTHALQVPVSGRRGHGPRLNTDGSHATLSTSNTDMEEHDDFERIAMRSQELETEVANFRYQLAAEPTEVELLKQQLEEQGEVSKLAHDALYDAVQQKVHYQEQLYHHRREIMTLCKKLIEAGNSIYTPLEQIGYYIIASLMYNLEQRFFFLSPGTPSGRRRITDIIFSSAIPCMTFSAPSACNSRTNDFNDPRDSSVPTSVNTPGGVRGQTRSEHTRSRPPDLLIEVVESLFEFSFHTLSLELILAPTLLYNEDIYLTRGKAPVP
ncbi:hypothetical protein ARMGADRAFT_1037807 [Armillaria gallica]|uniref:Uncharacterized protein n=1 Tax=Armillaria gallica TaxID=47427 RepID=A0A2H3D5N5_ARMGA|nr:hypothetical protein ARMGADRAFT_1037807 [Armillaria gallica]